MSMRTLLIDFDSKIPNLALMKESAWGKAEGHEVGFDVENPDQVVVSVIFQKNKGQALGLREMFPGIPVRFGGPGMFPECGGLGDAELIMPDYDLYPSEYSQGFTTRGCIRACQFCLVPKMEGKIRTVQPPSIFHADRFDTCMLMDNNLLAAPHGWIKGVFDFFKDFEIKMDVCQGFDARLLTEEWARELREIKHKTGLRFAWDNLADEPAVLRAIGLLKGAGFNLKQEVSFYVLSGYNTTFDQDLYRCNRLRELGVNSFVMRYHKKDRRLNKLAKWANRRWAYWSSPFPAGLR
jgi:hypothetical protein